MRTPSVTSTSRAFLITSRRHADRTGQLWLQRLKDSGSNKRLNLIYLANGMRPRVGTLLIAGLLMDFKFCRGGTAIEGQSQGRLLNCL